MTSSRACFDGITSDERQGMDVMRKFDPDGNGHIDYREFIERFGKNIAGRGHGRAVGGPAGGTPAWTSVDAARRKALGQLAGKPAKNPRWTAKQQKRLEDALSVSEKRRCGLSQVRSRPKRVDDEEMRIVLQFNIEMDDDNYQVMRELDPDGSGCFDYNEFLHHLGGHCWRCRHRGLAPSSRTCRRQTDGHWVPMTESKSAGKPGVNPLDLEAASAVLSDQLAFTRDGARCIPALRRGQGGTLDYDELRCVCARSTLK